MISKRKEKRREIIEVDVIVTHCKNIVWHSGWIWAHCFIHFASIYVTFDGANYFSIKWNKVPNSLKTISVWKKNDFPLEKIHFSVKEKPLPFEKKHFCLYSGVCAKSTNKFYIYIVFSFRSFVPCLLVEPCRLEKKPFRFERKSISLW